MFLRRVSDFIGVYQRRRACRLREAFANEFADKSDHIASILSRERSRDKRPGKSRTASCGEDSRSKNRLLRLQTHDPILSGTEHQRRRLNRTGVGEQPFGSVVKIEKNVHGDLPEDERIGVVARGLFAIVREHFRFHVALHESRPEGFAAPESRTERRASREMPPSPESSRESAARNRAPRR